MERIHVLVPPFPYLSFLRPAPAAGRRPLPLVPNARRHRPAQRVQPVAEGPAMNAAAKVTEQVSSAGMPGERPQVGVLPWRVQRNGEMRILLITSRGRGRWIVPKGWPVKGSPLLVAASREAFEEAGVIGDLSPAPVTTYRYQKVLDDGSQARCRVAVFAMNVRGTLSHWREKGQRKRQWFSLEQAADRLNDAELAAFVRTLDDQPERLEPFRCAGGRMPPPGARQTIGG